MAEFRKWEGEARKESGEDVAQLLDKAISDMEKAGKSLSEALEKVGGPLESDLPAFSISLMALSSN